METLGLNFLHRHRCRIGVYRFSTFITGEFEFGTFHVYLYLLMILGLYSLSRTTYYRQIPGSLGTTRLGVVSFWHLAGISTAALPKWLSNIRAIGKVKPRILRLRVFVNYCRKTSFYLMNRGPDPRSMSQTLVQWLGLSDCLNIKHASIYIYIYIYIYSSCMIARVV